MKYNLVINQNHNYEGKQHDYLDVGVLRRFSPVLFQMLPQNVWAWELRMRRLVALVWLFFTVCYHMCPLCVCPEWWLSLSLLSLVIAVMTTQASQSSDDDDRLAARGMSHYFLKIHFAHTCKNPLLKIHFKKAVTMMIIYPLVGGVRDHYCARFP